MKEIVHSFEDPEFLFGFPSLGSRDARFFGTTYQNCKNIPYWPQNIPNDRKSPITKSHKTIQMFIKYTIIFHSKEHKNFPTLEFFE
jgi:hypothetical protein